MITEIQIGKNGLTDGIIERLKNDFKTHELVKIHILKSAGHEKGKVKEINNNLLDKLGSKYTGRIVGFTLIVRKWRKDKR